MRTMMIVLALLLCCSTLALAQSQTKGKEFGYGYVFAAPGGTSSGGGGTLHVGGGGEGVFGNGLGIGAEIGALMPTASLGDGIGLFSVNGSYHFLDASKSGKVIPFVTGGYTGFFRSGYANGVNFGAGVNYWFKPRVGLRVEFRDNIWAQDNAEHFFNIRVGLTFR